MKKVSKAQLIVASKYAIVASDEWKKDLATTLLADAVAGVVDGSEDFYREYDAYEQDFLDEFRRKIVRPQTDIVENVKDLVDECELDLDKYLDLEQIDEISTALHTDLGITLQEIYDEDEMWATHAVLQALGHGVSPFDDDGFLEWLEKQGSEKDDWRGHKYFEGPHGQAMDLVQDALEYLTKDEKEDDVEEAVDSEDEPEVK